jgi:acyl-CoA thioester hydrolase
MPGRRLYSGVVQADWLDALDHVNFLEHQRVADKASDQFWLAVGGKLPPEAFQLTFVIVETHVRYERELRLGDCVCVDTQLVTYDHRRMHLHHALLRGDEIVSVVQILGLAFDVVSRRASQWPASMLEAFALWREQADVEPLKGILDWGLKSECNS